MTAQFAKACELEWMSWDAALKLVEWPTFGSL